MRPREAFAPDKAHYVSLTLDEILGSAGVSLEDAFGADPNHLPPPALQFPPLRLSGSTVTVHVNYYEASDGELPIPLPEPCPPPRKFPSGKHPEGGREVRERLQEEADHLVQDGQRRRHLLPGARAAWSRAHGPANAAPLTRASAWPASCRH